jgi:hypothetical protein
LARRRSRTPIGLGQSAPRFGGSGPYIVKVSFILNFDKRIFVSDLMLFFVAELFCCYRFGGVTIAITTVAHSF